MDDPNMHTYGEPGPDDAEIGRQWRENSSLERWFPLTAERLAALEAENAALKRDLQYARDGLTKGRTRMREDIERLTAENAALKREAHTWWTAARDATKAETERCALVAALHSQYPVTTDYDRGYSKARADAAAAIRLGPNAKVIR